MLLFIFKAVTLPKISFLIVHSEKKLKLLLIPGLLHIHNYPSSLHFYQAFLNAFFYIKYTSFSLSVWGV